LLVVQFIFQFACVRIVHAAPTIDKDLSLKAVMRAKKAEDLSRVTDASIELEKNRAECQANLAAGRLPYRCFKVIRDEVSQGLLTVAQSQREDEWLTRICLKRAEALRSMDEAETGLAKAEENDLPADCRTAVDRRWGDLRYKEEAENPAALFGRRTAVGPNLEPLTDGEHVNQGSRSRR
jgi:hypothetical protein